MVASALSRRTASCLFLSPLWPEPGSSAAGVRTEGLLRAFQRWGYDVHYAAAAKPNRYTEALAEAGVSVYECGPNREEVLASVVQKSSPGIVVFDRFMAEEAYSFRVRELAPDALRVLDMQDLHALRRGRQALVEAGASAQEVLAHRPSASSEALLRELGAIQRSDLTLVCSPSELHMLTRLYGVNPSKLCSASFFCEEASEGAGSEMSGSRAATSGQSPHAGFDMRKDFVTIGGFRHPPNVDGVEWLAKEIWPRIRSQLPSTDRETVAMRVYGAYPNHRVQKLHDPTQNFHICGHAKSLDLLANARVLVAPLRYGAGIKGKIVDAWRYGVPVVTTPVGAEGMSLPTQGESPDLAIAVGSITDGYGEDGLDGVSPSFGDPSWGNAHAANLLDIYGDDGLDSGYDAAGCVPGRSPSGGRANVDLRSASHAGWGGLVSSDPDEFAAHALKLYFDRELWDAASARARVLLRELYSADHNLEIIRQRVEEASRTLHERREADYSGALLWQHNARSTEYFSRWIELKESHKGKVPRSGL